ncbi:hypothetical protein VPH46_15235 [Sphingomonas sp. MJ1 (PH-R8)]|uniref:hypothetical protein n=1 Tax=Sphingomonas sp. MJ1 (PH-R8) TaxID=3112950 RepID=UPI003A8928CB
MLLKLAAWTLIVGTQGPGGVPLALPLPPPFTPDVDAEVRRIGERTSAEFARCGIARTNSNGRYVEAIGTPSHSPKWKKAKAAMRNALNTCQGLRYALRDQVDHFQHIVQEGAPNDAQIAQLSLSGLASELQGVEHFYNTETSRYRQLVSYGRAVDKEGS